MQDELQRLRSSTPQPVASKVNLEQDGDADKRPKRRRRVVSVRRFKISSDGTKQLISVTPGPTTYIKSRNYA